jgi:carboxyl-terminal processing protease
MLREGSDHPLEFSVVRDEIPRYSVDLHFMIKPGIGYMHVSGFQETTEHEVSEALDQMGDLKGLVLDLRQNPGGLLSEGVGVADKFLKKGQLIVSHHGRSSPEKRYTAARGNGGKDYPLVVLVNRGTASAAEIVAGAIQDHDRGLIAGETTFGKGLVQTVYPLAENTGLALTTAKYYTPSGRLIQRDYSNLSLYDYYYNRENEENTTNKEVKLTDGGRTVYGGGGITPDVKLAPYKSNKFQEELLQHYALFNFAKKYANGHKVAQSFEVDDVILQEFRKFLDEEKIAYTEGELLENNDWLRSNLKSEIFVDAFGQEEGLKVRAETDPDVVKALELMPQARALADNARKVIAERNSTPPVRR